MVNQFWHFCCSFFSPGKRLNYDFRAVCPCLKALFDDLYDKIVDNIGLKSGEVPNFCVLVDMNCFF